MISEPWDIVVVPFPFTERPGSKRRPALVLSRLGFNEKGHTILAMITTQSHNPWPGDTAIKTLETTGLHVNGLIRLKIFTLDNRLILKKIGRLSTTDRNRVADRIRHNTAI